jgi:hypothetical protein
LSDLKPQDLWRVYANEVDQTPIQKALAVLNEAQLLVFNKLKLHTFSLRLENYTMNNYTESEYCDVFLEEDEDFVEAANKLSLKISARQKLAVSVSSLANLTLLRQEFETYVLLMSLKPQLKV